MRVAPGIADFRAAIDRAEHSIGFVPTMGALHDGHMSLIKRARAESQTVAVSIFVNPTQFGPNEDFARYPRDLDRDLDLCEAAGADVVFAPSADEMYPPTDRTLVEVRELGDRWEGATRPGHFRGVATVVAKLLRIARCDRAYFGEKDYQQLQIIKRMASDLFLDVDIVACPTVREGDGLALSSRNAYLGASQRRAATVLYAALREAQQQVASGEQRGPHVQQLMASRVAAEPLARLDYAAVVHPSNLEPFNEIRSEARALIAAWIGEVRLLDNAPLVPGHATNASSDPG